MSARAATSGAATAAAAASLASGAAVAAGSPAVIAPASAAPASARPASVSAASVRPRSISLGSVTLAAALAVASFATAVVASSAAAQSTRYRRPFLVTRSISAYFDHAGGGCADWACGSVCYDGHTGTDYPMPIGSTVVAAAAGRVVTAFNGCDDTGYYGNPCGGRCGNHVVIEHDDGTRSTYCHMRYGSHRVGVGDRVGCGQAIGESASSGSSTGPHLHFGHRSPGASAASDSYAGSCSGSTSHWVDQGPYRGNPSSECQNVCTGESCNGVDDDCDGRVDEDLRRGCGTDVGECVSGIETCRGGDWSGCEGSVAPRPEDCDGRDEDCDGSTDEDLVRTCGTDVGECVAGTEACESARWSACRGAVDPVPERCDTLDNDCDGEDDDERICEREEVAWQGSFHAESSDSDASGDGRADACAMSAAGVSCITSSEHSFTRVMGGAELDAGDFFSASTLRMGDLDGDGDADACGRQGDRFVCWLAHGGAFRELVIGPSAALATSFELADVDGDGLLDACVRTSGGLACHLGTGHGFAGVVSLPALADAAGFADVVHHGSLRFADVDGDGRSDACARDAAGLDCWRSEGAHFGERIRGPRWSDAAGFDALSVWSTLHFADVSGDGRADACIRAPSGFTCAISDGHAFTRELLLPAMADATYERVDVYSTIRMADLDGDGRSDVCAREPSGVRCWLVGDRAFGDVITGAELSDERGWTAPARFRSLRLADVDGDGRADLCARHADGLRCDLSTGHGFSRTWLALAWSDESGIGDPTYATTIRIAGGRPAGAAPGRALHGVMSCSASAGDGSADLSAIACVVVALIGLAHRRRR